MPIDAHHNQPRCVRDPSLESQNLHYAPWRFSTVAGRSNSESPGQDAARPCVSELAGPLDRGVLLFPG